MVFNPPPTPQQSQRMFLAGMLIAATAVAFLQYILPSFGVMPPLLQLLAGRRSVYSTGIVIHWPIKEITHYDRGFPVAVLGNGDTIVLKLPDAGQKYVRVGDFIVKAAKMDSVTVYRRYSTYTEVCLFSLNDNDGDNDLDYTYPGLRARYRLPHPPLPPR